MQAQLSEFQEAAACQWCQKTAEGVRVAFDGGFLQPGHLCWKCLQTATRVHHNQSAAKTPRAPKEP